MEILSKPSKRQSLTLLEILLSITVLALVLPTLGISGHKLLRRYQYMQDIAALKNQLQMAHDMTLHTHVPVYIELTADRSQLLCSLSFENSFLESKLPKSQIYKHIRLTNGHHLSLCCSSSGALNNPITLLLTDSKKQHSIHITLKGYPHVVRAVFKK